MRFLVSVFVSSLFSVRSCERPVLLFVRYVLGLATVRERNALGSAVSGLVPAGLVALLFVGLTTEVRAANPWEDGIEAICDAFFGVIGKGLAIVAVVIGGLMFAFGEGGSKSAIAGLIFGAGMVLGAGNFLRWLDIGETDEVQCG